MAPAEQNERRRDAFAKRLVGMSDPPIKAHMASAVWRDVQLLLAAPARPVGIGDRLDQDPFDADGDS